MAHQLALAIAHHLFAFTLLGAIVAEFALMRTPVDGRIIARLAVIDAIYGLSAVGIIVVGVSRIIWGAKPADFYLANPFFWAKMGAFAIVGLLSILPTLRFLRWRRTLAETPHFAPASSEIGLIRRFLLAEIIVFAFIPAFAATMARGIGRY